MTKQRIGEVLKRAREKKGLRADEVAKLCEVTRGQYYQWELATHILAKNLPRLAKALDLKESYLKRVNGVRGRPEDEKEEDRAATAAA
jgi:transcriptional regulator with XRE-family HTH domain